MGSQFTLKSKTCADWRLLWGGFITTMLKGYKNMATSGEETTVYNAAQLAVNVNGKRFIDD